MCLVMVLIGGILLAMTSYVLGIGPIVWLRANGYISPDNRFWTMFYAPLNFNSEALDLYCDWWESLGR
jgi:hypothetical protein